MNAACPRDFFLTEVQLIGLEKHPARRNFRDKLTGAVFYNGICSEWHLYSIMLVNLREGLSYLSLEECEAIESGGHWCGAAVFHCENIPLEHIWIVAIEARD